MFFTSLEWEENYIEEDFDADTLECTLCGAYMGLDDTYYRSYRKRERLMKNHIKTKKHKQNVLYHLSKLMEEEKEEMRKDEYNKMVEEMIKLKS